MRRVTAGSPEPLGVTLRHDGVNVAVFSAHAAAIELCLYGHSGDSELERIMLPVRSGSIFHGFVAGVAAGDRYALRAHGAYDVRRGHRFNPAKLLIDPYVRALDRPFVFHPTLVGGSADGATRDDTDSAPFVPRGLVTAAPVPVPNSRPCISWAKTIVYELHVRGFTRTHPEIPEALRGTCAGLAHPAAIAHLTRLGITTVELMPIAAAIDERHLTRIGLTNYWGYNPGALFVPDPRLAPGGIDELAACVATLHRAGIEVILDVVLNHTGEGDALGPTISLRGLDNATYYRSVAGDSSRYIDDTGCGNTLALDQPAVLRLAMDVLRYYAEAAGVDGFRFDLATTLARRNDGFDSGAPLLQAIEQDPLLRDLKLIAEPWDVGPGGHRLGAFPAEWAEWNDRFRDCTRRLWRGDPAQIGEFATRLAGSGDIFTPRSRQPSRSVNFVTAHDGFTLADLVAYATKHNEANGENNRDGSNENLSWNHGGEGPTEDPAINAARRRDICNLLATVLLARGTPMLAMGDELGRTQRGNNNAYAQDNALTWVDWATADEGLIAFVARLIELRNGHAALHADRWLTGAPIDASGIPDVEWRCPDGRAMTVGDWANPEARTLVAILYAGPTETSPAGRIALAFNIGGDPVTVHWPDARIGFVWRRSIDTSLAGRAPKIPESIASDATLVAACSLIMLVEERDAAARKHARIEPRVLDQLASAAGIAGKWWDVAGKQHVVGTHTKRALLKAMGWPADSTSDARAHLHALAEERECRELPAFLMGREAAPTTIALPLSTVRAPRHAALRLRDQDGSERVLPFAADALPANAITAVDGRAVVQRMFTLPPLPIGDYTLGFDDASPATCRLVVAPDRCYLPTELGNGARRFGLAAHLYALKRRGDWGIGDFATLSVIAEATARAGGSIVGINPLHMLFTEDRERASPYHPSDRRFLDPIYVDVEAVPDFSASSAARAFLAECGARIAALASRADVDYPSVWQLKRAALELCFAYFEQRGRADPLVAEYDRFVAAGGASLRGFAIFAAIAQEHPRKSWERWPHALRSPDGLGIAEFAEGQAHQIRFALYLQWLADRQLGAAANHAGVNGLAFGFFRDLAVGAASDGAEIWANPSLFAHGVSIGAPPDPFSSSGQNWNLRPPIPDRLWASGGSAFRESLVANMRHAGALRIDHVMGLSRLYWIPDGANAAEGAYVGYPLDALLGLLARESVSARCFVVGEDLGTVPEGFRERLAAADVLSYRVLWFERESLNFTPPSRYPAKAVTSISTHDLPTIAGWWSSSDITEKRALGLLTTEAAVHAKTDRMAEKCALAEAIDRAGVASNGSIDVHTPHDAMITAAIHRYAGATPSALVLMQADDLAGESVALNLPGTDQERPNWRRKVRVDAHALWQTPSGVRAIADLSPERGVDAD